MFLKKLIAEQNYKKDRLSGFFMAALITLVVSLLVARVVIANRLVEASGKLRDLDKAITLLEDSNQQLAQEIRGPQSITQIEDQARSVGFVSTSRLVFLNQSQPVALNTQEQIMLR